MEQNEDRIIKVVVSQRLIKNSFKNYVLEKAKGYGIQMSDNELMTLFYLRAFPGLTQKQMSVYLDYDLATAGRILSSMADKGFITRVKSKEDSRRNDITVTEKGNDVMDGLFKLAVSWFNEYARDLLNDEVKDKPLMDQIIILAKELTKDWGGTDGWKQK